MSIKEEVEQSAGKWKILISCSQNEYSTTVPVGLSLQHATSLRGWKIHLTLILNLSPGIVEGKTQWSTITILKLLRLVRWLLLGFLWKELNNGIVSKRNNVCVCIHYHCCAHCSVKQFNLYKIGELLAQW